MGRPIGSLGKNKIREIRNCANCNKEISLHPYRVLNTQNFYCNRKCKNTSKIVNCSYCNKEMVRIPARIKEYNFCDKICMGKYQTEFRSGENSKHFLGDYKKYYGSDWNHQRNLARERDNYKCQICGIDEIKKQHDVHHIKAFATFGIKKHKEANELNNLLTLCNSCHSSIEPKRTKKI